MMQAYQIADFERYVSATSLHALDTTGCCHSGRCFAHSLGFGESILTGKRVESIYPLKNALQNTP